jgi:hypothetical protein
MTLLTIVESNADAFAGIADREEFVHATLAVAASNGLALTEDEVVESIESILNPHTRLADQEYELTATGCTCAFCTCSYAVPRL